MKLLFSLALVAQAALSADALEFGRVNGKRGNADTRSLERDALIDEESRVFMEFERYLEMSMSHSMSYSTGSGSNNDGSGGNNWGGDGGDNIGGNNGNGDGVDSPSIPVTTPSPNTVLPIDPDDSMAPSSSPAPTETLSAVPTSSPTTSPAPTSAPVAPTIFECSDQGVVPAGTPALVTTPISLTILYEAESTVDSTDAFLADLEQALFSIAVEAALECNIARRQLQQLSRKLATSSEVVGDCTPTEGDANTCFTLETNMEFEVNDNVDQERTAFLAYSALQSAMNDYTGDGIDSVVRLTYLAPTPTDPSDSNDPESAQTETGGVSPLAIGAAAALVAGGTLALFVWHRNRSTRNKRHVELEEDGNSMSPVSLFSAERDTYEDA
mmetsp:Transcript_20392/g.36995  ORF Transcript_20392/g.36995 Transcript_20392/m.36995 type:complete len:384 (+) Transcript_20392:370-1521(+)|eukprot:CAMPEP_0202497790 /NCGR_PEP_ID=MMETSP1361-20130828/23864_1 /ASSEMBLY_ACC=CAM_ASM_000849 /TAXON_ID=210615 /ORGANISM="Staurosira complex sp., Strain CCMP2646" /LENGTH=383 /DNA_ID=CAMNT_0049129489 /DNA_START=267 /DNA_END=1418 /DNA_ORIENTATION=-